MKKHCYYLFFFFILASFFNANPLFAQLKKFRYATDADITPDTSTKKTINRFCSVTSNYIPDTLHPELSPMRYVRLNVHIIQDANGRHNFPEDSGKKFVKQMIADANQRLSQNQKMLLPRGNHTPVIKIPFRYVLTGDPSVPGDDGIYFHRDDTLFFENKRGGKNSIFNPRQQAKYGIQKDSVINIFMIEHPPDSIHSKTYRTSYDGVGLGGWVKLVNSYNAYIHPSIAGKDTVRFTTWEAAGLLNHELGHCFNLNHTWNVNDGCDDTPESPGCWNYGPPPCDVPSNNVMDYNAYKNAYTPCQLGRVYAAFMNGYQRNFLVRQWCDYDSTKSITIPSGTEQTWQRAVDVYGDLILEKKSTLTIQCRVSIPPRGNVILMPGSTLIIDGGTITSTCISSWQGIEVSEKKKDTKIIFKNGGKVDHVIHPL